MSGDNHSWLFFLIVNKINDLVIIIYDDLAVKP
jgi:hypothetical protein